MRVLVWRQQTTPMFRELPVEEAMMWDEATNGIPFGVLCEMLATYDDPDSAAARGAPIYAELLGGWQGTSVSGFTVNPAEDCAACMEAAHTTQSHSCIRCACASAEAVLMTASVVGGVRNAAW